MLVTGGRTHRAAREAYPDLPETAFVRIGDFIGEACRSTSENGFRRLIVFCMPGKLAKYALGHDYTHAHHVSLAMSAVAELLGDGVTGDTRRLCCDTRSMRELLESIPAEAGANVISILAGPARRHIASWAPGTSVVLRVIGFQGEEWTL